MSKHNLKKKSSSGGISNNHLIGAVVVVGLCWVIGPKFIFGIVLLAAGAVVLWRLLPEILSAIIEGADDVKKKTREKLEEKRDEDNRSDSTDDEFTGTDTEKQNSTRGGPTESDS